MERWFGISYCLLNDG